ncbi:MAG: glycoside hydrolase family 16 protein [Lutibacter sp.]
MRLNAQSPSDDENWQIDMSKSDEFSGTSLDLSKWHPLNCPSNDCYNWGGSSAFSNQNVSVSGGILYLKCDGPSSQGFCFNNPPNFVGYKTAGITSINENYDYGYIEIYARFPGFVDGSGNGHADKFWPALWAYHQEFNGDIEIDHDEIDIIDQCCSIYADAKTTGSGCSDTSINGQAVTKGFEYRTNPTVFCNSYHKYAVEWNTDRVKFYFDDVPYYEIYDTINMDTLKVVLDFQLAGDPDYPFYQGTSFPQYMYIDYFRYYTLKKDCNINAAINDNQDLSNFNFAVKQNIRIGNGSSYIFLSSGDIVTFRATNEITINGDFTVPLGSELNLIPTPCN